MYATPTSEQERTMMRSLALVPVLLIACGQDPADAKPRKDKAPAAAPASSSAAAGALASDTQVATWAGGSLKWSDVEGDVGSELTAMHAEYLLKSYERSTQAVERVLIQKLLDEAVAKAGVADIDTLLKAEVEAKTPAPTDAEIIEFYPTVARQLGGATLEEAKPMLAAELLRRKQGDTYRAYIDQLRADAGAKVLIPYPELPRIQVEIASHDPTIGPDDAPITIVQFAEYQCYFCNKVTPTIDQVLKEYDGKVRMVFKDYPLPMHDRANAAAQAAHCAGEQGKYWELNRVLMANQQALQDSDFQRYVADAGGDVAAWQACYDSGKYKADIAADMEAAQKVGVSATPSFFVNGLQVSGAQPFERFQAIIERELNN